MMDNGSNFDSFTKLIPKLDVDKNITKNRSLSRQKKKLFTLLDLSTKAQHLNAKLISDKSGTKLSRLYICKLSNY